MQKKSHTIKVSRIAFLFMLIFSLNPAQSLFAYSLTNSYFNVTTGSNGEISSLVLVGDAFSTNYVLNASNAPEQNTTDHQWFGELLFEYRVGTGTWTKASTNRSGDVRSQSFTNGVVSVVYQNSGNSDGIRNFKLTERYSLVSDYLYWEIELQNTSSQAIEFGDIGVPLAFNEKWVGAIYEQRVLKHSFVGRDGSFVYALRPSGVGPFVALIPDINTGSGFEYQELWHTTQYPNSKWAFFSSNNGSYDGLNVFYIHSSRISTRVNNGYIGSTSMTLQPGATKTYAYKIRRVNDINGLRAALYNDGLIDVNVVPGMILPRNLKAKVDLHTQATINSLAAQYPADTSITYLTTTGTNHKIYEISFNRLGHNNITINFGSGKQTVIQFYVMEDLATAIQQRATHIVTRHQVNDSSQPWYRVFDEWLMGTQRQRGSFGRYWAWGDDWGYQPGLYLAEKNSLAPVAAEVQALNNYVETFLWNNHMREHHSDYAVNNFWQNPNDPPPGYNSSIGGNHVWLYRGYAWPHVYNTFFSMYKIAKKYPNLINYSQTPRTYLLRAYGILNALHSLTIQTTNDSGQITGTGPVWYKDAGLMGESANRDIIAALQEEGLTTEANRITGYMNNKYQIFARQTYPFGSEYNFDNTGEEAVYTLAKMNNNSTMMQKVVRKTLACRSIAPVWYQYAAPLGINGELSWNFQYTTSLAGYTIDDWMRTNSATPADDARMAYAAKLANFVLINSGQMSTAAANLGAVAWTYQAAKGLHNIHGGSGEPLYAGFRSRSGEGDLGLFGALRILSADVAVDPVFGLTGYGCDASESGGNYVITPQDGLSKRLNLITEKLYIELDYDKYSAAVLSKNKNYVELDLVNQTNSSHTSKITLRGLAAGTYRILVNNGEVGTFSATSGQTAVVNVSLGSSSTYNVKFTQGTVTVTLTPTPTPTATPTPTPTASPTPQQNPIWSGGPYTLNGTNDYIDVPDGLTGNLGDFSIATWVKLNSLATWARVFDFGTDTTIYMFLTVASSTGYPRFAITNSGNSSEQVIDGTAALPTGSWQHLAIVKSGNAAILYINRQEAGRNTSMTLQPIDLGSTVNNYIGRSQYADDPYLNGSISNFAIYNRALSASEVSTLGSNPPDDGGVTGDVNGDGSANIVDAMLIAQYVSGLNPAGFDGTSADVNCDGIVNINDALLVARFAASLITQLGC